MIILSKLKSLNVLILVCFTILMLQISRYFIKVQPKLETVITILAVVVYLIAIDGIAYLLYIIKKAKITK